jgi:hypothetical protein
MTRARDVATQGGLVQIVPTSVSVGSGSASVSSNGAITYTGITSITINNCFSAKYDNYRIVISNATQASAQGYLRWQLASGGTAISTTTYNHERIYAQGTSLGALSGTGLTSAPFTAVGTVVNFAILELSNPFLATPTKGISQGNYSSPSTPFYSEYHTTYNSNSTSYDGLNLNLEQSTLTGTVRIYGYNNG